MIKDVLRRAKKKAQFGLLAYILISSIGCQNKLQTPVEDSQVQVKSPLTMVSFPKIVLRLEIDQTREYKLAELNFNFYGSHLLTTDFETQKDEIRNLILIHFANSDFKKIPETNRKIKDPKLSAYLNQFLSKGKIEDSEYQLVRVY